MKDLFLSIEHSPKVQDLWGKARELFHQPTIPCCLQHSVKLFVKKGEALNNTQLGIDHDMMVEIWETKEESSGRDSQLIGLSGPRTVPKPWAANRMKTNHVIGEAFLFLRTCIKIGTVYKFLPLDYTFSIWYLIPIK